MRPFNGVLIFALLLLQGWPAPASDMITNIMSPPASYQYAEDFSSQALTSGGIQSLLVSFQFPENFSSAALTMGGIMSPITSYQYFEWPGGDVLQLQSSPRVSYYYQFSSTPGSALLHGRVTDTDGLPLSGATVSAMVYLTPVAQASTDANGNYQMSSLDAGVYSLSAWGNTHQTSMRTLTLNANTARQDFQLKPVPPRPTAQEVRRFATINYTVGDIMGSVLRIYNGSAFVPVTIVNRPSPDLKTIVMTHGWVNDDTPNSSITATLFNGWPPAMAAKLSLQGVTFENANILAWDWRYAASSSFIDVGIPGDRTPEQGIALGQALQHYLGAEYCRQLHFLGHSLGTLVNASTVDYLHGERIGTRDYSPTPWKDNLVHITLFDQAQLSEYFPPGLTLYQFALPRSFTWADNYKSLVGIRDFPNAVNINLQKGLPTAIPRLKFWPILEDSHAYPIDWYQLSITSPLNQFNPLGFKRSYEFAPSLFRPSDIQIGSTYHQIPSNHDELALELVSGVSSIGLLPDMVVQTTVDTIDFTGRVVVQVVDTVQNGVSDVFNYVGRVAEQGRQAVVNVFDWASSLGVQLNTGAVQPSQLVEESALRPHDDANGGNASSTVPMVWLPLQFPPNATAILFDFMAEGDPAEDVLVCGIGTNNLFSVAAKYIPTNQFSASRPIDVSAWAGTTNELFFGFMGGTSANATLRIQNIRFYSLQPPQLAITRTGNTISLAWPSTASGYSIVTTTNLATPHWETLTDAPTILGNNYILTNSSPHQMRFFRLEQ